MSWFSKKDKLQKKIEKEMAKIEAKSASKLPPIESTAEDEGDEHRGDGDASDRLGSVSHSPKSRVFPRE